MRKQSSALIAGFTLTLMAFAAVPVDQQIEDHLIEVKQQHFSQTPMADIEIELKMPDGITHNNMCDDTLTFAWRGQPKAGANTLKLGCSNSSWQAYVPAQIKVFKQVVIAKESLSRGETLTPALLTTKKLDVGQLRLGYFEKPADLNGHTVQRTLKSGQVLTPFTAKAPMVIQRGDWVMIQSGNGLLRVTSEGEAMKDGQIGQQIPVKNLKSGTTIRAWVIRKGVVSTQP